MISLLISSSLLNWNGNHILIYSRVRFGCLYHQRKSSLAPRTKIRHHKRPCAYYANSTATFRVLLIGDLTFKLNQGPMGNEIPVVTSLRPNRIHNDKSLSPSRNTVNLITVNCSNSLQLIWNSTELRLCVMNTQSLNNKAADFIDYICDHKPDIVALAETWFHDNESATRTLCTPEGYGLLDHP